MRSNRSASTSVKHPSTTAAETQYFDIDINHESDMLTIELFPHQKRGVVK
jgi:hypothetical protein